VHPESLPGVPGPASAGPDLEAQLVDRFWARLRLFSMRRLGDAALAEDVAQETLRRVVEALRENRVRDQAALPAFVFQTARHVCQHHERSAGREAKALARLGRGSGEHGWPDALGAMITAERRFAVRQALGRLSHEEQALLAGFYYEQLDADVLAQRLGITPGAVRVRKHRALKRLGDLLGRPGDETMSPHREP
jgi:RNA polymerase sigma-70 factor (ECF subfamily)